MFHLLIRLRSEKAATPRVLIQKQFEQTEPTAIDTRDMTRHHPPKKPRTWDISS
jgi:hypothetical protein